MCGAAPFVERPWVPPITGRPKLFCNTFRGSVFKPATVAPLPRAGHPIQRTRFRKMTPRKITTLFAAAVALALPFFLAACSHPQPVVYAPPPPPPPQFSPAAQQGYHDLAMKLLAATSPRACSPTCSVTPGSAIRPSVRPRSIVTASAQATIRPSAADLRLRATEGLQFFGDAASGHACGDAARFEHQHGSTQGEQSGWNTGGFSGSGRGLDDQSGGAEQGGRDLGNQRIDWKHRQSG